MKSAFLPRLVNHVFGDPGLHVSLRWQGTALQFDLGRLDRFPAAELLKLTHVFVSHTHIDHFVGFDRVMRLFLSRDATLEIFGPPGIKGNVQGKLAGYTWNLVDGFRFEIRVHEVHPDRIDSYRLPAATSFAAEPIGSTTFAGVLYDTPAFQVCAAHLDHRIPCLGFALVEKSHLNVRREALERLGVPAGPWLNVLKSAIRAGDPGDSVIEAEWREQGTARTARFTLGELRESLLVETPGQRLAYVVDTLFSAENARKIAALASGADVFYCEAPFLDADREQAVRRYHLTARQAGTLARWAGARRLEVFHFSPRYEGRGEEIYAEAKAAFRGEIAADEPV